MVVEFTKRNQGNKEMLRRLNNLKETAIKQSINTLKESHFTSECNINRKMMFMRDVDGKVNSKNYNPSDDASPRRDHDSVKLTKV